MPTKAEIKAEAQRLLARIGAAAVPVETDILQPAGTLLDLYGEDIRARAYTTADPVRGEQMLRPDFTVPIVQMHMANGAEPARYAYAGEVFRRQEVPEPGRPAEFVQVGLEVFDGTDPAARDADVFVAIHTALAPLGLRAAMGDIGLLSAAVGGLSLSDRRRAALMRHLWRPHRFRALLTRFAGQRPVSAARAALLERVAAEGPEAAVAEAGPLQGKRTAAEVAARLRALAEDAEEPPLPARELDLIDDLLAVRAAPPDALERLHDLTVDLPALEPAVDRLDARFRALAAQGVDLAQLEFEASYGRTTLEYYDGMVFGLYAARRPDLPPVASGGRYDALTRRLGQGREIPAVGGVIRPGLVLDLGGAA
ncbi:MAG: ATP phosphoribosyltransferase regulatory subunit [Pseudomonadota bacterium]